MRKQAVRRFRFRLERLLSLRKHIERQWEIKLAEATGACALIERRIGEIKEEIGEGISERFASAENVNYEGLLVNELYISRLYAELEAKKKELEIKTQEREKIKKVYLEHSKKRKVLDKLKERKEAEYYKLQIREDFKAADEIGSHMRINR